MSINPHVYSVFIGSPKGLEEERKCFYDRLNWFSQHYEHEEVLFRPVSSQEVPGGYGRPQEHINEVLYKCEYAVFILHDRMGTPPGGGPGSGTEEEFKLAKKLHKQGTIKSIALFMKEIDPARLADPDEQLASVLSFRNRIDKKREFLYKNYSSIDQFRDHLFEHLFLWCRQHRRRIIASGAFNPYRLGMQERLGMAVVRNRPAEDLSTFH
jgi:Domain of unknown function (DUF4062)